MYLGLSSKNLNTYSSVTYSTVYDGRWRYCASFSNLKPGTKYYYKLYKINKIYSFKTLPPGNVFRFAVIGDTRTGDNAHRAVVDVMKNYDFTFYLNTGDFVLKNHLKLWDIFMYIERPLLSSRFFFPVEGNHDVGGEDIQLSQLFYFPKSITNGGDFYSFWIKKNFFLVASSELPFEPGTYQYNWIKHQLQAANREGAIHKFMFFHRPPYSSGFHGFEEDEGMLKVRKYLAPLAITYGVTVVFNGHEHCYERSYIDGVYFITTGGGGATPAFINAHSNPYSQFYQPNADLEHFHFVLVEVGPTYVELKAITMANKVMDHLIIGKKPKTVEKKTEENKSSWGCTEGNGDPLEAGILLLVIGLFWLLIKEKTQRSSN